MPGLRPCLGFGGKGKWQRAPSSDCVALRLDMGKQVLLEPAQNLDSFAERDIMADHSELDERLRARQMQAEEMQHDNAESLDRSLQMVSEMQEMGTETLEKLNEQGEQLNRISEDVDKTDDNLTTAKYILKKIRAPFTAMFVRKPKKKEREPLESPGIPPPRVVHRGSEKKEHRRPSRSLKDESHGSDSKPPNEFVVKAKENIKKEDQAIDQIAVGLNNLEEMSKAMGLELERQSGQIEGLDSRVDGTLVQMSSVNRDARMALHR